MKNVRIAKRLCIILMLCAVMMMPLVACGKETDNSASGKVMKLDVLANLDKESVTQDSEFTNFNVNTEDGKIIHFQGINIEVTENGISMGSGAVLCSLDYMGLITDFTMEGSAPGCWIEFGTVYGNNESVDNIKELFMGFCESVELNGEFEGNIESYETGFFGLSADNNGRDMLLTSLVITYDTSVKQVLYSELDTNSKSYEMIANFPVYWDLIGIIDENALAEMKMAEPGSITSDIIAGLDHGSIVQKGDSTFFSSTMSDGAIVRFEGKNITISEEGIKIRPDSSVTSLDAVGKIYQYSATIKDTEQYGTLTDENGMYDASNLTAGYGYTYSGEKISVDSADEVHTYGYGSISSVDWNMGNSVSVAYIEPNFIYFSGSEFDEKDFVVSSLCVGYNPSEKVTGIRAIKFNEDITGAYLEGEIYNKSLEGMASDKERNYSFYLVLELDTQYSDMTDANRSIFFVPADFYNVKDIKDADGNVLDKATAVVNKGTTLDIEIGDYELALELDTLEQYKGAAVMNDLVPYAFPSALGTNHTLVVPVVWADQTENATEENLALYKKALGRVEDENGKVTDYSDTNDEVFSLSEYFDTASYGKYQVNSFVTDWYYIDRNFSEYEQLSPDKEYADIVLSWVKENYSNLDMSYFDQDENGYVDSMIIINSGIVENEEMMVINSYGGAIHRRESYYGDYAGTAKDPNVNCYVNINQRFLQEGNTQTLIHEFSHNLGLIDYYDVNYSGIDAVGGFDMQSKNVGDWNAYSKLAVGWMNPQIVEGLKKGESVEITINSMAQDDDVIVIPAAGNKYDGPFGEYIMIDLFSDDGVNQYDAQNYGLSGTTGVRISHVDARMEKRTMEIESKVNAGQKDVYDIGTIHYDNSYSGDDRGFYNIEVIQSGKKNTFTNLTNEITSLKREDLFYQGDEFSIEEYGQFFYNQRMDNGEKLGYTVSIVNIGTNADGTPNATVKITAK